MEIVELFLLAFGLSMDVFAIVLANVIIFHYPKWRRVIKMALVFGATQAAMPALGWLAGRLVAEYIQVVDHWIAFVLLCGIGSRIIYNTFKEGKSDINCPNTIGMLVLMAIATSIDALAVGITFAFLNVHIITAVIIIGMITFIVAAAGLLLGRYLGFVFSRRANVIGGLLLISLGFKIMIEHVFI